MLSSRYHDTLKTREKYESKAIMIRFIHTADIHFGVENYGKIDPTTGIHSRLLDFAKALNFIIDVAIEKQVDFFLFCGDAYKTHNPTQTQQKLLLESFLRLHHAGIPVVIIIGNHDHPVSFGKTNALELFSQLPTTGFHVIQKPQLLPLQTKNGIIQIVGIPWPTRATIAMTTAHAHKATETIASIIASTVSTIITRLSEQLDPNIPSILAGHLTVSNGIFSGSERTAIIGTDPIFLPSQLALSQFDYVALGHLHRHQQLSSHPPIVYSGSPERIDFGERNDTKGFCLVSIEKKRCSYEFIKTPVRDFIQLEINLCADIPYTDQIIQRISQTNIDNAILKILYRVPQETQYTVDTHQIHKACARAMHLAGIIPLYQHQARTTRMQFHEQESFMSVIETYLQSKPELAQIKTELLEKITALQNEIATQENQE